MRGYYEVIGNDAKKGTRWIVYRGTRKVEALKAANGFKSGRQRFVSISYFNDGRVFGLNRDGEVISVKEV